MPNSICTLPLRTLNDLPRPTSLSQKDEVAAIVRGYLADLHRLDAVCERRRDERFPFPVVIQLIPVEPENLTPLAEPILVVGKQISVSGLGFYHTHALPYRCYLVSIRQDGDQSTESQLVFRSKWCRFVGAALYECGGQFIKIAPSNTPTEQATTNSECGACQAPETT